MARRKCCNSGSVLEHGSLPGRATDSDRSGILSSAAVTPVAIKMYRGQRRLGDFRNDVDPDGNDNDNPTTLESYKFDSEVIVVDVDTKIAICSGFKFCISDSRAISCKEKVLNFAMIKHR